MGKIKKEIDGEIVRTHGLDAGASVVGIASSDDFGLAPDGFRPADVMPECRSVIILGSPFPREAVMNDTPEYIDIRNAVNAKIGDAAKKLEKRIKEDGHKAKALTGLGGKWVGKESFGLISLKHAAELAGLGVIGRNYLLINPEHGTLLWFSAVLTDVELTADEKFSSAICDGCDICVKACPSGALNDPSKFNRKNCTGMMFKMTDKKWKIMCYRCRQVCPRRFGIVPASEK